MTMSGSNSPAPPGREQDQELLQSVMDHSAYVEVIVDSSGYIEWFNHKCQQLTGFHASELVGEPIESVIRFRHEGPSIPLDAPSANDGERAREGLLLTRSGIGVPVHWWCSDWRDEKDEIRRILITADPLDTDEAAVPTDGTGFAQRIGETAIDSAIEGIVVIDSSGIICSANPAAQRLFGYAAAEMCGRNVSMLMPEPHRSNHDGYIRRYMNTGERRIICIGREVTGCHRDGSPIELQLAVAECCVLGHTYFIGYTHDIGPYKRAEREARERLAELAQANRRGAMGELASSLAHEIRQPLMAVHTTADACRTLLESGQNEPEALKGPLEHVSRQARRAGEIISQLHRFVRGEDSEDLSEHYPSTLVEGVLLLLTHKVHAAGVMVERRYARHECLVRVNRVQIEQVIFNLIDNALDAMKEVEGQRVLTVLTCASDNGSPCEIAILDTGPGLPEGHSDALFTPYFTTKSAGMGQGLPLCRSIVEGHGGEIAAEQRPGGGAAVRVTLPQARKDGTGAAHVDRIHR